MSDVTCSQVNGIVIGEHPPRFVLYDDPITAIKPYTSCPEKVSECPVSNSSSLTMEDAIQ